MVLPACGNLGNGRDRDESEVQSDAGVVFTATKSRVDMNWWRCETSFGVKF